MRKPLILVNDGRNGPENSRSEQEVLTPPELIHAIVRAFGGGIELDPCAPSVQAPSFQATNRVRYGWGANGLGGLEPDLEWPDRTFVNPPFEELAPWLEKARIWGACSRGGFSSTLPDAMEPRRLALLCPLRSHRPWFRAAAAHAAEHGGGLTLLPGIKFVGHKSIFPAPLCLLSWGVVIPYADSLITRPEVP